MDSAITRLELRASAAKPKQAVRPNPPVVRLPRATADLVNRLLSARCGGSR